MCRQVDTRNSDEQNREQRNEQHKTPGKGTTWQQRVRDKEEESEVTDEECYVARGKAVARK